MLANNYDPVADIYDIYNQADYDIDFYIKRYRNFKGKAIELMAGTGRLSIPLLKNGMDLDCLDISNELLEILMEKVRKYNLKARTFNSDIRKLKLENVYDLVIIGFNSLSEITDDHDLELVFQSIYSSLRVNGEFVFTLYNPFYRRQHIKNSLSLVNEFEHNNESVLFFISSKEEENSIVEVTQLYEFYNERGFLTNKRMLKIKFRLISNDEIELMISNTGFVIKNVYGNYNEEPFNKDTSPFMIYILSK